MVQNFRMPNYPFFRQLGEFDCGIACLRMIVKYHGGKIPNEQLEALSKNQTKGVSLFEISECAEKMGLRNIGVKISYERFADDIPTPCIAYWRSQHFIVIYKVSKEYVWIADPAAKGQYIFSKEIFKDGWICDKENQEGILLLMEPTPVFSEKSKNSTF